MKNIKHISVALGLMLVLWGCSRKPAIELPIYPGLLGHIDMSPQLFVSIDRTGKVFINGKRHCLGDIADQLQKKPRHLLVRADRRCDVVVIENLLAILGSADLEKYGIDVVNLSYSTDTCDNSADVHDDKPLRINIGRPDKELEVFTILYDQNSWQLPGKSLDSIEKLREVLYVLVANNHEQPVCLERTDRSSFQDMTDLLYLCHEVKLRNIYLIGKAQQNGSAPIGTGQ